MRVERTYEITGGVGPREHVYVETTETTYCENPECEAQHDDPEAKWDTRSYRTIGEFYHRADAERVVRALEAEEGK
jgi:hypothetical protein